MFKERPLTKSQRKANTDMTYARVFVRDQGQCRIPGCRDTWVDLAHLEPKGMGGDHGLRTTPANCVLLCAVHHRGPVGSVHAGDLTWRFQDEARGADGPMTWELRERR